MDENNCSDNEDNDYYEYTSSDDEIDITECQESHISNFNNIISKITQTQTLNTLLNDEIDYLHNIIGLFIIDLNDTNRCIIELNFHIDILTDTINEYDFLSYTNINPNEPIKITIDFDNYVKNNIYTIKVHNLGILTSQIKNVIHNYFKIHYNSICDNTYDYIQNSFILNLSKFIIYKIRNYSLYCVCCDTKLEHPVFIQSICESNQLCEYQSLDLGITKNLLDIFKYNYELFMFLTILINNTCKYKPLFLEPYPEIIYNKCNNNKIKMAEMINKLLKLCPDKNIILSQTNELELQILLNNIHTDLYYLLKWIFNSNKSYLLKVYNNVHNIIDTKLNVFDNDIIEFIKKHNIEKNIKCIFKINSNSPEKEYNFNTLFQKYNNKHLLFHGSAGFNWHSILRKNLINFSGTNRMANGAAFGNGIYLSDNFATSYYYSSKDISSSIDDIGFIINNDDFETYKKFKIMAIVEAINNNTDEFRHSQHYIISNNELVALRYILILH